MTKSEREYLEDLIREIDESDDKIDPVETLVYEVRKMVNKSKKKGN
jgi:hypothetical protein